MAEDAAHRDDLPFVMKGMSEDVMKDERGRTDGGVSIGEMEGGISVELLVRQAGEIGEGTRGDFTLEDPSIGDGGPRSGVLALIREPLEPMDPGRFAMENVDHLGAERGEAEASDRLFVIERRDRG
jgi:hypothetical protein